MAGAMGFIQAPLRGLLWFRGVVGWQRRLGGYSFDFGYYPGQRLIEVLVAVALQNRPLCVLCESPEQSIRLGVADRETKLRIVRGSDTASFHPRLLGLGHGETNFEQEVRVAGSGSEFKAAP